MPNIADVMLNKRLDELASIERTLDRIDADADPEPNWLADLTARRDHLRGLCIRGLWRCYPDLTGQQVQDRLMVATRINR